MIAAPSPLPLVLLDARMILVLFLMRLSVRALPRNPGRELVRRTMLNLCNCSTRTSAAVPTETTLPTSAFSAPSQIRMMEAIRVRRESQAYNFSKGTTEAWRHLQSKHNIDKIGLLLSTTKRHNLLTLLAWPQTCRAIIWHACLPWSMRGLLKVKRTVLRGVRTSIREATYSKRAILERFLEGNTALAAVEYSGLCELVDVLNPCGLQDLVGQNAFGSTVASAWTDMTERAKRLILDCDGLTLSIDHRTPTSAGGGISHLGFVFTFQGKKGLEELAVSLVPCGHGAQAIHDKVLEVLQSWNVPLLKVRAPCLR